MLVGRGFGVVHGGGGGGDVGGAHVAVCADGGVGGVGVGAGIVGGVVGAVGGFAGGEGAGGGFVTTRQGDDGAVPFATTFAEGCAGCKIDEKLKLLFVCIYVLDMVLTSFFYKAFYFCYTL